MRKLIVALLVVALCIVAPVAALAWGDEIETSDVFIAGHPYQHTGNSYFDATLLENDVKVVYAGWCINPNVNSIKNEWYDANLSYTVGVSPEWNKVNWVINHKGEASYQEVQEAIWRVLDVGTSTLNKGWNETVVQQLVTDAKADYIPKYSPEIGAVLVEPIGRIGQDVIIEIPMPECPTPVPEFPTMVIPVFLVGSLMVAGSILKKE